MEAKIKKEDGEGSWRGLTGPLGWLRPCLCCSFALGVVVFRNHWWSGKIISDEGFTVSFSARNTLVYEARGRTMTVRTEGDGKAIDVFQNSIIRWDNDSSEVDAPTNNMIADNIVRALEFRGFHVYLVTG